MGAKTIARYIIGISVALIILTLLEFTILSGWYPAGSTIVSIISAALLVGGLFLLIKERSSKAEFSWWRSFALGVLISWVAGLLLGIFSSIYVTFIDENLPVRLAAVEERSLRHNGKDDHEIMLSSKATYIGYAPSVLLTGALIWNGAIGTLSSLLILLFFRRRK